MDALTASSDWNDNLTSSCSSPSSTTPAADRDQRHRAPRYGFGFKPPQAKHSRPGLAGAGSRPARPSMPLPPTGDAATAEDEARPLADGDGGHMANGDGDVRSPTSPRGPPTVKKRQKDDVQRQTAAARTKQSVLRRPAQKAGGGASGAQRQKVTASNGVTQPPEHPEQLLNGKTTAPAATNGRRRPPADKSVKLLVNYRSTNDRHAPLQSAYGNRDFFGSSSAKASTSAPSVDVASEVSPSGSEDTNQPTETSLSRSAC